MAIMTEVLPARKSEAHAAIRWSPDYQRPGCGKLTITGRRCQCSYAVARFPSDFAGSAFHFEKLTAGSDREAEAYDVFVGPAEKLCDCRGFLSTGDCKHVLAVEAIIENGWDQLSLVNPDADVSNTEAPF